MKAWVISKHGGNEVLVQKELSIPVPGKMEACVRIKAAGLNRLDLWVRNGVPGHSFSLPIVPGSDGAGVIEVLGPNVNLDFSVGDAVILNPLLSCGKCSVCTGDNSFPPICPEFGLMGETRNGTCSEYVCVPAENLVKKPLGISWEEAASLSIAYVTAWSMLTRKAKVTKDDLVLVHAGGSGVGVAAIQFAKILGATVFTTIGSEQKKTKAKQLGADFVIDYNKEDFKKNIKNIINDKFPAKRGIDVIIDHVGEVTFSPSMKLLNWGGRYVFCGATNGSKAEIDLKAIFFKNISILGSTMGSRGDLLEVIRMVSAGKLKPVIDSVLNFHDLPKAFKKIEDRDVFGKVIVNVDSGTSGNRA